MGLSWPTSISEQSMVQSHSCTCWPSYIPKKIIFQKKHQSSSIFGGSIKHTPKWQVWLMSPQGHLYHLLSQESSGTDELSCTLVHITLNILPISWEQPWSKGRGKLGRHTYEGGINGNGGWVRTQDMQYQSHLNHRIYFCLVRQTSGNGDSQEVFRPVCNLSSINIYWVLRWFKCPCMCLGLPASDSRESAFPPTLLGSDRGLNK